MIVGDTGGGGDFTPHPEGAFPAVCVDVIDRGNEQTNFGIKHRCQIVFETDQWMEPSEEYPRGAPFTVRSKKLFASLNEKANLRKFLETWRGKAFTEEQVKGFDMEQLIGGPAFIQVVQVFSQDHSKIYANIQAIMKLPKGMTRLTPSGIYVRQHLRGATASPQPARSTGTATPRGAVTAGQPERATLPSSRLAAGAARTDAPGQREWQAARATAPHAPPPQAEPGEPYPGFWEDEEPTVKSGRSVPDDDIPF